MGGNAAACGGGGGGRTAEIGPEAAPFAYGRGGTGPPTVPLAWGAFCSDGGPLANKVWGLLFWELGLFAAKILSGSTDSKKFILLEMR